MSRFAMEGKNTYTGMTVALAFLAGWTIPKVISYFTPTKPSSTRSEPLSEDLKAYPSPSRAQLCTLPPTLAYKPI
eukprot:1326262-Amorphochlora_amoeboformis.AAC.2